MIIIIIIIIIISRWRFSVDNLLTNIKHLKPFFQIARLRLQKIDQWLEKDLLK